ncbi:MAG: ATP-binding protein [Actinomycetia bacterium]|nr:ATP-binding protein [Actinomycetes bacterium]
MGIKITSVSEAVANNGIKILIHGLAGSGKTVFCATTGVPTLIISAESGLLSIANAPSYIKTTVVKTIHELEQAYEFLLSNIDMFECVALDSISEIAEVLLADEKANAKDPRQAYGNLSDRMLDILRKFRDLENIDVIMSSKQVRIEDPDTNTTRYVPSLPGKSLTNSISYLFDEVFALRVEKDEDGDDYRIIQTGRDRNYEAKDRSGALDMFEQPMARLIFAKIRESMPSEIQDDVSSEETKVVDQKEESDHVDHDTYWYHSESESVMSLPAGTHIHEVREAAEACDEISKEEYKKISEKISSNKEKSLKEEKEEKQSEPETEEKEEQQEINFGKEETSTTIENNTDDPMYLYHNTSDAVLKLSPGDLIDDDGNIDIIDFKTFVEHSRRIKAAKETEE